MLSVSLSSCIPTQILTWHEVHQTTCRQRHRREITNLQVSEILIPWHSADRRQQLPRPGTRIDNFSPVVTRGRGIFDAGSWERVLDAGSSLLELLDAGSFDAGSRELVPFGTGFGFACTCWYGLVYMTLSVM